MIKAKLQDVKRTLILEAAADSFERLGYEALKVSELAKQIGVSVGTIYGYFDSKEGLYLAYVKAQIARYLEELDTCFAQELPPEEHLKQAYLLKLAHFSSKRRIVEDCAKNNPLFFSNIRHSEPELLEEVYVRFADLIRQINPQFDAEGALRLAYQLNGLSDGCVHYWLMHDGDLGAQAEQLHQQMLILIKGC